MQFYDAETESRQVISVGLEGQTPMVGLKWWG